MLGYRSGGSFCVCRICVCLLETRCNNGMTLTEWGLPCRSDVYPPRSEGSLVEIPSESSLVADLRRTTPTVSLRLFFSRVPLYSLEILPRSPRQFRGKTGLDSHEYADVRWLRFSYKNLASLALLDSPWWLFLFDQTP